MTLRSLRALSASSRRILRRELARSSSGATGRLLVATGRRPRCASAMGVLLGRSAAHRSPPTACRPVGAFGRFVWGFGAEAEIANRPSRSSMDPGRGSAPSEPGQVATEERAPSLGRGRRKRRCAMSAAFTFTFPAHDADSCVPRSRGRRGPGNPRGSQGRLPHTLITDWWTDAGS